MKVYYKNEFGTLWHGDCLEVMEWLLIEYGEGWADMVLTDIPYAEVNRESNGLRNLDKADADTETFPLDKFMRVSMAATKGSAYYFCGIEQVSPIRRSLRLENFSTRMCVWHKSNPSPMNGKHIWLSGVECCVYGKRPKATFNEHCKNTVWKYPTGRSKNHPTEKPLDLFAMLISTSTNLGDTVFDPCMGSGTTAAAAETLGRKWAGCEISEEYCEIIAKRLDARRN